MRMIRAGNYKLIWYPVGNRFQLFDLERDPNEMKDLSGDTSCEAARERLSKLLLDELYCQDTRWIRDGQLVGEPDKEFEPKINRGLSGQRGYRF